MERTTKRRLGLACLGVGLITASIAAGGGAASAHPGPEPPPVVVPDGSCADFAATHGGGQVWLGVHFDVTELVDGHTEGGVTLTWNGDNTFDWSAPMGLDAVFVGAGAQGGNLYVYAPTAASFEHVFDDGLTAPGVITDISFCYDVDGSTTTSTTEATTTTEPTTTTTEATTTTTEATTTTTTTLPGGAVAGVSVTAGQPPTTVSGEVAGVQATQSLPRTGADDDVLLALGVGLLVAGVALVLVGDGARVLGMRRR